ncbi:MAG: sensor domain-containing phosphodiesterase [Gammaproteobacteria bacterium]|nr:sensor domain-containing phosphodiesterase [Gammaproteobacteria bacterium]
MIPDTSKETARAAGSEFEPYTKLLRALLPRLTGVSIFNAASEVIWSSDMVTDPALVRMVAESMRSACDEPGVPGVWITDGEPIYIFWLWRPGTAAPTPPFAAVLVRCKSGQQSEQRTLAFVHALVRPALEILTRELVNREQISSLSGSLAEQDHDLDMLLSVSGNDASGEDGGGDELKAVLRAAVEHIQGGLAAIIVPEKGLVLVRRDPHHAIEASLVARAHRHLVSTAQLRSEAVIVNRMCLQGNDAQKVYRLLSCAVLRADGRAIGVLALFRPDTMPEFTPRQARLAELLARRVATVIAASYDALTGLLNRPAFEQRVQSTLRQEASVQRWWSAVAVDTNRMHVINDSYGMHVGDKVIAQLGELIRKRIPPGAIAARISGDRFALLLPVGLDDAARFAESLRQGAERLGSTIGDGTLVVSISVGVAAVEPRAQEFTHAFAAAETACKAANDRGRNRVEVFQEADESIIRRFTDINVITDLRAAITAGRLRLNAQLLLPLGRTQLRPHFELLLRMRGADGETVGPDHFMSAAHRYQLMPEIDRWVVSEALRLLRPHSDLLAGNAVVFTINCSGQSLKDGAFTEFLTAQIAASGINPEALCFELTESAAVGNLTHAETLMRQLRKLGCGIALDDFGTGLSSLSYLRSLPISMLKIDGSFVRDVLRDPKAESTIQAIAQLARAMSLVTVAEYVETDEIRHRIAQLGVDYGQGFAIGQPVPIEDVLEQLPLYAAVAGGTVENIVLSEAPPTAAAV